ncbi:hypothetical protein [Pseudomonas sp. OV546]|uniref:TRAFAC clade GTPase domain-containing protein n=1 Tax=Pseudomonas sp. OV546 TaxID=1881063 RepID=UPI0008E53232|nr:hypothetical protein [Pseudomonas sp. OV546]SFU95022.1 hypothetical protein SAMN05428951_10726 [Pseudomonas sp. OV546]
MRACTFDECTVSVTGRCIQGFSTSECPHIDGDIADIEAPPESQDSEISWSSELHTSVGNSGGSAGLAVLERLEEMPRLPPSMTLGTEEARELMCNEYTTMVGIVGLPASGKTACLVSAYLLLSKGQFQDYSYADSKTLMAFEQIARGSRQWTNGEPPNQLTVRTELVDDRQAGFLHFKLRRIADGKLFNVLLPDLPGEWSKSFIDRADSDRFDFIKSATVIWVMVDGREFVDGERRNYAKYRTELLIERLAGMLLTPPPRVILVPSWRDLGDFPEEIFKQIRDTGLRFGIDISLAPIASFSANTNVEPGEGISDLLTRTFMHDRPPPVFWPDDNGSKRRKLSAFRSGNWPQDR